ncbi:MAG: cation diffusion facilitator family transporter [Candidatus Omnitrophota bacterium]
MNAYEKNFRRAVLLVALLNFAYFGVEFAVALAIKSVSLFADSIDFLEDTFVNLLIFIALGWSMRRRAMVGMLMAGILLVPSLATLWSAWQKFLFPAPPDATLLSLAGFGALVVNLSCAFILARFRRQSGSLAKAAFLSARNDALANVAIIGAAIVTAVTLSPWPDVVVGLGIFFINLDAARDVYTVAREELKRENNG